MCLLTQLQTGFAEIICWEVRFAAARSKAVHQDLNIKKYLAIIHSGISTCTLHCIQVIVGNYLSISRHDISYQVLNISEFRIRIGSGVNWTWIQKYNAISKLLSLKTMV
jgi:hypothetical protein